MKSLLIVVYGNTEPNAIEIDYDVRGTNQRRIFHQNILNFPIVIVKYLA